jgi:hypothetical protein
MARLVPLLLCLSLLSCSRIGLTEAEDLYQQALIQEAQCLVLLCTGDLEASDDLFDASFSDLQEVRLATEIEPPIPREIIFIPPWVPGALVLTHEGSAAQAIDEGRYTAWDSLNSLFAIERIEPAKFSQPGESTNHLYSREILHPQRMCESYLELPEVLHANPQQQVYIDGLCEQPNLYPFHRDGYRSYLFHNCRGNCRTACLEDEFWYFRFVGNDLQLLEYWDTEASPEEPTWWPEAEQNYNRYYYP